MGMFSRPGDRQMGARIAMMSLVLLSGSALAQTFPKLRHDPTLLCGPQMDRKCSAEDLTQIDARVKTAWDDALPGIQAVCSKRETDVAVFSCLMEKAGILRSILDDNVH